MEKKNELQNRGRPKEKTDEELMQLALDIKYKNHGKSLTPSFLEKETKVGRNTWSRRMKQYIDELNKPALTNFPIDNKNEIMIPSIDLIFKKYSNDKTALKNELLEIEILFYEIYKELKEYKLRGDLYEKNMLEIQSLKSEVSIQKKRAEHYEQLYNTITLSSVYPHLQDKLGSPTQKLNLKQKLISMESYIEKNTNLENLSSYFPDVTDEQLQKKEKKEQEIEKKKQFKNMQKLLNKFDV